MGNPKLKIIAQSEFHKYYYSFEDTTTLIRDHPTENSMKNRNDFIRECSNILQLHLRFNVTTRVSNQPHSNLCSSFRKKTLHRLHIRV